MKAIPLTQGKVTLVDDEDFKRLSLHRWCAHKQVRQNRITWYAVRNLPRLNGKRRKLGMHREILGIVDPKTKADHRDGDTLNNRRSNLRVADSYQNAQNKHKEPNCSSRFKGVHWNKSAGKWQVQISINGQRKHLGYFVDETVAARTYDRAAADGFGEFALQKQAV